MATVIRTERPPVQNFGSATVEASVDFQQVVSAPLYVLSDPPDAELRDSAVVLLGGSARNKSASAATLSFRVRTTSAVTATATLTATGSDKLAIREGTVVAEASEPATLVEWTATPFKSAALNAITRGGSNRAIAWSPDSRYSLHGFSSGGNPYQIIDWESGSPVDVTGTGGFDISGIDVVYDVAWSGSGDYLALAHFGGNELTLAEHDGSGGFTLLPDPAVSATGQEITVAFGNDRLAVGFNTSPFLACYNVTGTGGAAIAATYGLGSAVRAVAWSPNGRYLAVITSGAPFLTVFDWNSGAPVKLNDPAAPVLSEVGANEVSWRSNAQVTVATDFAPWLQHFAVSGSDLVEESPGDITLPGKPICISWAGALLAIGHAPDPFDYAALSDLVRVFDYSGGAPVLAGSFPPTGIPADIAWAPDAGRLICVHSYLRWQQIPSGLDFVSLVRDADSSELIVNGSFEDVEGMTFAPAAEQHTGNVIPGWTSANTDLRRTVSDGRAGFAIPLFGERWLQWHGSMAGGVLKTDSADVEIYQEWDTLTAGETVTVTAHVIGNPSAPRQLEMQWNGSPIEWAGETLVDRFVDLVQTETIPAGGEIDLPFARMVLKPSETLEVKSDTGDPVDLEVSFIYVTEEAA